MEALTLYSVYNKRVNNKRLSILGNSAEPIYDFGDTKALNFSF